MGCNASKPASDPVAVQKKASTESKKVSPLVHDKNKKHDAYKKEVIDNKKLGGRQAVSTVNEYARVDEHARNAPPALKNSVEKLVAYLSQVSSEPRMKVRAIFVWISENIAYDVDGYFGKTEYSSCEAESVLRNGKSVCAGYANVVEMLCTKANVPVKNISGYAKGYSHSIENPFTTDRDTNHAWNAVQLDGKWFLLDSTWGTGHVSKDRVFKKSFTEFYFLTDPTQFIYSHFPYMDKDMESSITWQLLKRPVSLEEFNNFVKITPEGFVLGVSPVSHKHGLIKIRNEATLTFKCEGKEDIVYSTSLWHEQGNMLYKKPDNVFNQIENGLFTTHIHPHSTGTFQLRISGRKASEDGSFPRLMEYVIKCEKVEDAEFTFPHAYTQAQKDHCILKTPMQGNLKQNSEVEFHITSPYLNRVMINQTFLENIGDSFKGVIKTGAKGSLSVYGSRMMKGSLDGIYKFHVM